jgi:hypothetical protein
MIIIMVNAILLVVYHNQTYPRTTMGTLSIGNMSFSRVQTEEQQTKATAKTITLESGSKKTVVLLSDAGAHFDATRTKASLAKTHSWLPMIDIFTKHVVAVPVAFDASKLAAVTAKSNLTFHIDPAAAKLTFNNNHFTVVDAQMGYDLDKDRLATGLLKTLDEGKTTATAPLKTLTASGPTKATLQTTAEKLEKTLNTDLTYTYGSDKHKTSRDEIARWYKANGNDYTLDDFAIRTYVAAVGNQMGVHPKDLTTVVDTTKQTIAKAGTISVALQPFAATKTYHYCVASRGADTATYVPDLKKKLTSTYDDLRGWSLDGQVQFVYATSGCDFTVWLASSSQMPTFGAICDEIWNCEVANNVVVNLDRWLRTSDSWQAYGGSVEDYRVMLINHETGHMLGFQHLTCPGKGQPAPVMMQQSIDMGGCVFNIWPVQSELTTLRRMIGL